MVIINFIKKYIKVIILVALIVFIILLLAKTNKRQSIKEALKIVQDEQLRYCLKKISVDNSYEYVYQLKQVKCPVNFSKTGKPLYINDLNGLESFKYISELDLSHSRLKSTSLLNELAYLETLILEDSGLSSIDDLSKLKKLSSLNLNNNKISDLKNLTNLEELQELNLFKNRIKDLSPLAELQELRKINLEANDISNIDAVSQLSKLSFLNLNDNKIISLNPIAKNQKLVELYLRNNKIQSVEALSGLKKLKILDLSRNQIKDITPLSKLNLVYATLEDNKIEKGVGDLLYSLEPNNLNPELTQRRLFLDLSFNENIPCLDVERLRIKLANIESELKEPSACSNLKPTTTRRYYRKRAKKSGWKKFLEILRKP